MKTLTTSVTLGLPQLDVYTLSEDWALAAALEQVWILLAHSMGRKPSDWIDAKGDRMYGAVMALETWFDLDDPFREDDEVTIDSDLLSIRKPHAWGEVRFSTAGKVKGGVRILTSFIKRREAGSNKRFSKVRDIWTADDFNGDIVDDLLVKHHEAKSIACNGKPAMDYEVNRIQDFNTADFLYFKNFVRISKAAEWRENRADPTRLNSHRFCYYFGNVEDGDTMRASVERWGDDLTTELTDTDGRRLFLSQATAPVVTIVRR